MSRREEKPSSKSYINPCLPLITTGTQHSHQHNTLSSTHSHQHILIIPHPSSIRQNKTQPHNPSIPNQNATNHPPSINPRLPNPVRLPPPPAASPHPIPPFPPPTILTNPPPPNRTLAHPQIVPSSSQCTFTATPCAPFNGPTETITVYEQPFTATATKSFDCEGCGQVTVEPKNCGGVGIVSFFILFCFFVGKMERGGGCLFGKGGYNGIRANIW